MPTTQEHCEPDVFHEYKGVKIFHAYDDGDFDSPYDNRFSTSEQGADDGEDKCQFDARELPDFDPKDHPPYLNGKNDTPENREAWKQWHQRDELNVQLKRAIELAIDKGLLAQNTEVDPEAMINAVDRGVVKIAIDQCEGEGFAPEITLSDFKAQNMDIDDDIAIIEQLKVGESVVINQGAGGEYRVKRTL